MIKCSICKLEKPKIDFYNCSKSNTGKQSKCIECSKIYRKNYHSLNKERANFLAKKWNENNLEKRRNSHLKRYGITQEQYNALREYQNYCCAICGVNEKKAIKSNKSAKEFTSLHTDHCHSTGKVRGLLCFSCNALLGKAEDSIEILENAILYLLGKKTKEEREVRSGSKK